MALTTKRIIALPSQTDPQEGDYLAIDNLQNGTHKIPVSRIGVEVDDTLTEAGKAADAKAVGDALDEIRSQIEVTGTASGAIATFADGAEMPAKSVIVNITPKQSGTGTPSPDNVRQISGWESVNLYGRGKNLIDAVNLSPTSSARWINTNGIAVKNNVQYTLSAKASKSLSNRVYVVYADKATITQSETASGKTFLTAQFTNSDTLTFTFTANNDAYIYLFVGDVVGDFTLSDVQIEVGTTATDYEPYTGTTTPVSLGRTVYGGTLDVVTGVLTVDRVMVDLGMLTWSKYTGTISAFRASVSGMKVYSTGEMPNIMSSQYSVGMASNTQSNVLATLPNGTMTTHSGYALLFIRDDNYSDATAFKTAMNGVQFVYELATPQTYTLTGQEISTLLGENNVWADSGDVEVVYVRDLNLAINNLLSGSGTRSLGMMAMSAPTENTAEEQTEEPNDEDMR